MKPLLPLALFTLLATGGAATASTQPLNEFPSAILPVLVQVDAQGRVTDASPATKLSPQLDRLLRKNLAEMVSKPATDRHGHPMASQAIINVSLQTSPRTEGDYDAIFAYISTKPVPAGSWHWVHIDGHRLALANRDHQRNRRLFEFSHYRAGFRPQPIPVRQLPPPIRNASHPAPSRPTR
ncbi:hypothetical protein ASD22_01195 [Rhodanobacter sp. Root480]|uniref:hypothetical protein n=1 Tax=Rhodanobacter sp. Root480 TaxID=1736542 RepID=UPI0006F8E403|nr:hypothetical protein [Rhodanobacter sp. Root480]KQX98954.1 hypothetical protein ASD22_01195 [Rhodanobacter sp. Root480]